MVLTPAVAAAVKTAKVKNPLPYVLICAFIANAASFLLPISNPANLVIYGSHMPSLFKWVPQYFWPSVFSIAITFMVLRLTQKEALKQTIQSNISLPKLSSGGKIALWGIAFTVIVLLICSFLNYDLGLPTALAGVLTSAIVLMGSRKNPLPVIRGVSWKVIPLVAALFVIVAALNETPLIPYLTGLLHQSTLDSVNKTVWSSSVLIAFGCNLMNNLPAGLIAGNAVQASHVPDIVRSAVCIGIDLGPNLSITGSLATILWLVALRREGISVSAWSFLKLGIIIMTISLVFAIGALYI